MVFTEPTVRKLTYAPVTLVRTKPNVTTYPATTTCVSVRTAITAKRVNTSTLVRPYPVKMVANAKTSRQPHTNVSARMITLEIYVSIITVVLSIRASTVSVVLIKKGSMYVVVCRGIMALTVSPLTLVSVTPVRTPPCVWQMITAIPVSVLDHITAKTARTTTPAVVTHASSASAPI